VLSAAQNGIRPTDLILEPTFECIGVTVRYTGDGNFNAKGSMKYREATGGAWRTGHPLMRISDRPMNRDGGGARNPRFATSILYLKENTEYEVQVTFEDSDGVAKQLSPGKTTTRNSKVKTGGGKELYVDASAQADGDGSQERPFRTLKKAFTSGGPGDTVHFAKGIYRLTEHIQTAASGNKGAYLHFKGEPGAIITDADAAVSGVGKVKWAKYKQDVDGRWIYKADLKNVNRVMVRKKPGDPESGYFLWRFHPKSRGPHRGQNLQHMIDDATSLNKFGTYFQASDGLYLTLPQGVGDPAKADFQISKASNHHLWFVGHHVVVEDFDIELTVRVKVRFKGTDFVFRRLNTYGKMQYAFWTGPRALVEDCRFIFNSHWDWITSPPAKNGVRAWSKIKNGFNDTAMIACGSHSTYRFNLLRGHSNAIIYSKGFRNTDIHNNLITLTGDDCVEPDGPFVNGRVFDNKMHHFFNGFSDAPVSVGPVFIVRNIFCGYQQAAFKIRNGANGVALYYHNTCYPNMKDYRAFSDTPDGRYAFAPDGDGLRWMRTRNNILMSKKEVYVISSRRIGKKRCETLDLDYNCLWVMNGGRSKRIVGEKHSVWAKPEFTDVTKGDMRLKEEQPCVDAGDIIKGINDEVPAPYQYKGKAPDLGAHEFGTPLPLYGPRGVAP
jgi:hypothetical protein